jgi:hypothetical protein
MEDRSAAAVLRGVNSAATEELCISCAISSLCLSSFLRKKIARFATEDKNNNSEKQKQKESNEVSR